MDWTTVWGAAGVIATVAGFAMKGEKEMRTVYAVGLVCWVVHFALMGAWAAAAMIPLSMAVVGAALLECWRWVRAALVVNLAVLGLLAVGCAVEWTQVDTAIPALGTLLTNAGLGYLAGLRMTLALGAGQGVWIVAALATGSAFALLSNSLALGALGWRSVQARRVRD